MFQQDIQQIQSVITNYFEGIYYGDIDKLSSAFHPQCLLIGDINGQPYFKSLEEYLHGVKNRKSPCDSGEQFQMKILGIEAVNDIASAKLHLPMLGYNYYDYMSLSRIEGQWKIVNKIFTNVGVGTR
ncbi:putative lumazine-binding protein [Lacibacter cauensis]|uniref:Putative lumazine-binding protein n=1 Tax=Lacibacter cauensis TaxID=510947 RepID=A0A562SXV6_9BACT|nr:nuclear transport factor 2 family protein [Lacibacter cauensis]TWI85808.1 putative lumazine-binding protein [Lacibacter cauensis]